MNASIDTADRGTHVKIIATAIAAVIIVIGIGLSAAGSTRDSADAVRGHRTAIAAAATLGAAPMR